MFKMLISALFLVSAGSAAMAGSGACSVWENPSVMAETVLDDLKLMLDESVTKPA